MRPRQRTMHRRGCHLLHVLLKAEIHPAQDVTKMHRGKRAARLPPAPCSTAAMFMRRSARPAASCSFGLQLPRAASDCSSSLITCQISGIAVSL